MKKIAMLVFTVLLIVQVVCAQKGQDNITTFILVRHAEKVDDSYDPDLSAVGYQRAELLSELMQNVAFDAILSTPLIRTRETARPTASRLGLDILEYDHRTPQENAEDWLASFSGKTVLISGHSNSTPMHANALLGSEYFAGKFDEEDYGNLLIITITKSGETGLLHLRY
jgi:2,3-bisphosphoglycerate-dependent phosphoglycerate mutase